MNYCYWTIADGSYLKLAESLVHSARKVGVTEDFHVFKTGSESVNGCANHEIGHFDKSHYLFKLHILKDHVSLLPYDYFIFLDADSYFVRNPGNILSLVSNSQIHATFESNCLDSSNTRDSWWRMPIIEMVDLMRELNLPVESPIYTVNAGFWIIHREAISKLYELCMTYWKAAKLKGFILTEEIPLTYASLYMTPNIEEHRLSNINDIHAHDWPGIFKREVPIDKVWNFNDYLNDKITHHIRPAIVHCMWSKQAIVEKNYGN